MFLKKAVLKICSKFTEHPCRSVTSIKLQINFIEIALLHGCSPVNLLHIFRKPFPRDTSEWLLLCLQTIVNIPSYTRDNKDFLTKLNHFRQIQKESLLIFIHQHS